MTAALHVSLMPALKREPAPAAMSVLDHRGPRVCIGGGRGEDNLAVPVRPDASTLFGPRGACLIPAQGDASRGDSSRGAGSQGDGPRSDRSPNDGPHGPRGALWISDTGHHRLLGWARAPAGDADPADWVIGQPGFEREGRNAKGAPGAATLNVPTSICALGGGLVVADAWNHRVLIWRNSPSASNSPADVVLGQADFSSIESNHGKTAASANSLFWPYGVHWDGRHLWVADTGNRRVLMWEGLPRTNGQPADLVLGQTRFDCRDENGGGMPTAASMRWPHAIATWCGKLCVTDAGNNRILVWNRPPMADNAPADCVLGQSDFAGVDHNQSLYWPSAATLHMPYGVTAAGSWCISADTANSRIIAWHIDDCRTGAAARALSGQVEFNAKGDNGWRAPTRDSLSWPYGISTECGLGIIADSGNNRVLLWPLSTALAP